MSRVVYSDEVKNKILENGRSKLKVLSDVIDEIERGTPETAACRKYGINLNYFRRFVRKDVSCVPNYECNAENSGYMTWQDVLVSNVFGEKSSACEDFDEALDFVKKSLTQRENEVLDLRYKEDLTYGEVADLLGITKERVRQIDMKVLRKLQSPDLSKVLYYGMDYVRVIEDRKRCITEERKAELEINLDEIEDNVPKCGLEVLHLSTRIWNCLSRSNINTLDDLLQFSNKKGMRRCRGLGHISFLELQEEVKKYGITLRY